MRVGIFQHTATEGPGRIAGWVRERGHQLATTGFHRGDPLPARDSLDFLCVMGGPMNVYENRAHPWLREEKRFIEQAIAAGKPVLGVCLGAQLISDVLGAKVYQNPEMEIGWFPVRLLESARSQPAFNHFSPELTVLHWHGDTFDLPAGAVNLAESAACKHQAFACGDRIIGLQFHIEVTQADVVAFFEGGSGEVGDGPFVQRRAAILQGERHLPAAHRALDGLLDVLVSYGNAKH